MWFSDAVHGMALPARPTPFHDMGAEEPEHATMPPGAWKANPRTSSHPREESNPWRVSGLAGAVKERRPFPVQADARQGLITRDPA
jgi:hypothetical protein